MGITEQSQAVLLLTAWLGKPSPDEARPLAPGEWGRFALWLNENSLSPADLLRSHDVSANLQGWSDRTVDAERIRGLLERSAALGIALERWQRAGLWVMSRSDTDYPQRLKKRLRFDAPPVLFGCGNRQLLSSGGVAVVGSRDVGDADLAFTSELGRQVALQGYSVVSGGARGVDEAAMLGALACEGTVTGVLADNLLRASSSSRYRQNLMDGNLVLVSPFNPEAGFSAGNAMARNKYVYCLADAAVVIASAKGKGGTWTGAIENLKRNWVPLWVRAAGEHAGNAALLDQGAQSLPDRDPDVSALFAPTAAAGETAPASLFESPPAQLSVREPGPAKEATQAAVERVDPPPPDAEASHGEPLEAGPAQQPAEQPMPVASPLAGTSLYKCFLHKLAEETAISPLTVEQLQERLDLGKPQLNAWLKRAQAEGCVEKLARPVRYQIRTASQPALGL